MDDSTKAYVVHGGEAERRWMGTTATSFLATGVTTGDLFALVDERAHRGDSVPLHRHVDDVESFYVLEGEVTFYLDREPGVRAGAGSFVHVPAGTVHGFRIESEIARYLILTTPRHGEFYRAITLPSRAGGQAPLEPIDGAAIGRAARQYGIEFVGALPDD